MAPQEQLNLGFSSMPTSSFKSWDDFREVISMCDVLLSKYQGTIRSCYFFFLISYKERVLLVE